MDKYVVTKLLKKMKQKSIKIKNSKILLMGLTFKENCPDIRNSGSYKIFKRLRKLNSKVDLYDPIAIRKEIKKIYKINSIIKLKKNIYDVILILVNHKFFKKIGLKNILKSSKSNSVIFDLKNIFNSNQTDFKL
jgi:UDP-N-acetyl-D-galactosamine dehydrogenase